MFATKIAFPLRLHSGEEVAFCLAAPELLKSRLQLLNTGIMSPVLLDLVPRRNSALKNNPPLGAQAHITTKASDWLWCVFAIFLFVDICLFIWCVFRRPGTRLLNQLAIVSIRNFPLFVFCRVFSHLKIVLTISTWAYFAEASDLGWTVVPTVFNHYTVRGTLRQTWWVRVSSY